MYLEKFGENSKYQISWKSIQCDSQIVTCRKTDRHCEANRHIFANLSCECTYKCDKYELALQDTKFIRNYVIK